MTNIDRIFWDGERDAGNHFRYRVSVSFNKHVYVRDASNLEGWCLIEEEDRDFFLQNISGDFAISNLMDVDRNTYFVTSFVFEKQEDATVFKLTYG